MWLKIFIGQTAWHWIGQTNVCIGSMRNWSQFTVWHWTAERSDRCLKMYQNIRTVLPSSKTHYIGPIGIQRAFNRAINSPEKIEKLLFAIAKFTVSSIRCLSRVDFKVNFLLIFCSRCSYLSSGHWRFWQKSMQRFAMHSFMFDWKEQYVSLRVSVSNAIGQQYMRKRSKRLWIAHRHGKSIDCVRSSNVWASRRCTESHIWLYREQNDL